MTLSLEHCLNADKIIEVVNKAAGSVIPHITLYTTAEFLIVGYDMPDVVQVQEALAPRIDTRVSISVHTVRSLERQPQSNSRWTFRAAVLLLDGSRLGTTTSIDLESSLAYTRKCCCDDGWTIVEDDLILNMQGGRFYKR